MVEVEMEKRWADALWEFIQHFVYPYWYEGYTVEIDFSVLFSPF